MNSKITEYKLNMPVMNSKITEYKLNMPVISVYACDKIYIGHGNELYCLSDNKVLYHHSKSIKRISGNKEYVGTGSYDGTAAIYEKDSNKIIETIEGPDTEIKWIDFSNDQIAISTRGKTVWILDCMSSGIGMKINEIEVSKILEDHTQDVKGCRFYEGRLYSWSFDCTVKIYEIFEIDNSWEMIQSLDLEAIVWEVIFYRNDMCCVTDEGKLLIYEMRHGLWYKKKQLMVSKYPVRSVCIVENYLCLVVNRNYLLFLNTKYELISTICLKPQSYNKRDKEDNKNTVNNYTVNKGDDKGDNNNYTVNNSEDNNYTVNKGDNNYTVDNYTVNNSEDNNYTVNNGDDNNYTVNKDTVNKDTVNNYIVNKGDNNSEDDKGDNKNTVNNYTVNKRDDNKNTVNNYTVDKGDDNSEDNKGDNNNYTVNKRDNNNYTVNNYTVNNYIVNKDTVNKDTVDKDTVDKDTVDKDTVNNYTVNKDTVNKDTVNKDTVDKDTVNNYTVNKDTVNKDTVNKDTKIVYFDGKPLNHVYDIMCCSYSTELKTLVCGTENGIVFLVKYETL